MVVYAYMLGILWQLPDYTLVYSLGDPRVYPRSITDYRGPIPGYSSVGGGGMLHRHETCDITFSSAHCYKLQYKIPL